MYKIWKKSNDGDFLPLISIKPRPVTLTMDFTVEKEHKRFKPYKGIKLHLQVYTDSYNDTKTPVNFFLNGILYYLLLRTINSWYYYY